MRKVGALPGRDLELPELLAWKGLFLGQLVGARLLCLESLVRGSSCCLPPNLPASPWLRVKRLGLAVQGCASAQFPLSGGLAEAGCVSSSQASLASWPRARGWEPAVLTAAAAQVATGPAAGGGGLARKEANPFLQGQQGRPRQGPRSAQSSGLQG